MPFTESVLPFGAWAGKIDPFAHWNFDLFWTEMRRLDVFRKEPAMWGRAGRGADWDDDAVVESKEQVCEMSYFLWDCDLGV